MKIKMNIRPALVCACLLVLLPRAQAIYISKAFEFNAYVMEDMYGYNSDVEGALAVGGDLTLNKYGIGLELPESSSVLPLSVGGDVAIRDTRIYNGHAVATGEIDIDDTVGLYNDPYTSNTHLFYQASSYDFTAINEEVRFLSEIWSGYSQNGVTTVNRNTTDIWNITFTGTSLVNTFSISADDISAANKSIYLDFPTNSFNIINVYGEVANLFNTGFYGADGAEIRENQPGIYRNDGSAFNNVLFNFVDATELNMFNIGIKGSILAPYAATTFYEGQINGNLIVKSLTSPDGQNTGQINNYRFGDLVEVPEPLTISLLGLTILCLIFRRHTGPHRTVLS